MYSFDSTIKILAVSPICLLYTLHLRFLTHYKTFFILPMNLLFLLNYLNF